MPKKYQKPRNMNRRWTHNRPYHGQWLEYGKEETKEKRKLMKGLRHKLLFHIPLTDEEQKIVNSTGLTEKSALDRQGYVVSNRKFINYDGEEVILRPGDKTTEKWRYKNPKEMREEFGKPEPKTKDNKK